MRNTLSAAAVTVDTSESISDTCGATERRAAGQAGASNPIHPFRGPAHGFLDHSGSRRDRQRKRDGSRRRLPATPVDSRRVPDPRRSLLLLRLAGAVLGRIAGAVAEMLALLLDPLTRFLAELVQVVVHLRCID